MIHKLKKISIVLILCFISSHLYASCKFEFIPMKSSFSTFEKKISFGLYSGSIIDDVSSFPVPVEEICNDNKFKMFPVTFSFVKNKLHQIFIEDMLTNINHLDNLKYYYGNPTEEYEDSGTTGIKYYHWDLSFKQVFLVIKYSPTETIQNIEIVSNRFTDLMEKYNEDLEE